MKDMTFTVIVRVPLDMGIQQVTKDIRTGIGFGDPHITFEHTIIDPKPIEDVPLPSDDEPS
jgi:hypothetical protein